MVKPLQIPTSEISLFLANLAKMGSIKGSLMMMLH